MSRLQPTDGGAGVPTCRRSQIEVSEEGTGVASCRRSQIEVLEGAGVISSRGTSPATAAPPLEDDNLLRKILLRLPPQPSSLHRASAICKQWRCAATDPRFHRRFFQRHRKPPLVGIFEERGDKYIFTPVLGPPDRIPPNHGFSLGRYSSSHNNRLVGCRHGLVLIGDKVQRGFLVLDPITSQRRRVAFPPVLFGNYVNAAVLCTAGDADQGHMHGACHSCPFNLVLMLGNISGYMASVYSSETAVWSDFISTPHTGDPIDNLTSTSTSTLVGNVLYCRAWYQRRCIKVLNCRLLDLAPGFSMELFGAIAGLFEAIAGNSGKIVKERKIATAKTAIAAAIADL